MLKLTNIKKDYFVGDQTVRALKGITLDFRKAEFVSVLGPSGCGKTTLMNLIGGLDKATGGVIEINGKSTSAFKDSDWDDYRNKKVGFVFQTYYLIPHLSILSNVELALTISGVSKAERTRLAKEALIKVGLEDQIGKNPNQLSGGQMQRVAIARALVNSPDILLADEPTGALDTKTSEQILDLIKEISKEKLVIMVTHNSELAEKYSTRIIRMLDGEILDDSMPYDSATDTRYQSDVALAQAAADIVVTDKWQKREIKRNKKKASMSFFTAAKLSLKNLMTKKGRTILTSLAGSIGIIGVALILAVSNGMNAYIAKMQSDTLASNPINITPTTIDSEQLANMMNGEGGDVRVWEKFPLAKKVFAQEVLGLNQLMRKNVITEEYINYVKTQLKPEWYNDITYGTGLKLRVFSALPGETQYTERTNLGSWQQLLKTGFLETQYDLLAGDMPTGKDEIVLIVDEYNRLQETTLINLGIKLSSDEVTEYDFSEIIGKEYKVLTNDELYTKNGSSFVENSPLDIDFTGSQTLTIKGIVRLNQTTDSGVLSSGIGYTGELCDWLIEQNMQSEIIQWMNENSLKNPFSGMDYMDIIVSGIKTSAHEQWDTTLRTLGGNSLYNSINIYPVDFASKALIKETLSNYNIGKKDDEMITYFDFSELLGNALSNMVNIITYVLIAFTAISLVVSCVMIGIITYVSVIERTKEIGILRSIGARKKDVTRVFNAETALIGFFSGAFGVIVALLLSIPINIIINALAGVSGIASLSALHSFALILISIGLMLISGLIPARMAARKDPVTALRTE